MEGAVYDVQSKEDGDKLASYETHNYETVPCIIFYADDEQESAATAYGHTFMYCGNSGNLSEGVFDLEDWLRGRGRGSAVDELAARRVKKMT